MGWSPTSSSYFLFWLLTSEHVIAKTLGFGWSSEKTVNILVEIWPDQLAYSKYYLQDWIESGMNENTVLMPREGRQYARKEFSTTILNPSFV